MKLKNTLASLCYILTSLTASAELITFDDVPNGSIPQNNRPLAQYAGFTFSNLNWVDVSDNSYNYGAVSGDFAMLSMTFGEVNTIKAADDSDFYFGGLWAKSWGRTPESSGVDTSWGFMRGKKSNQVVWEVAVSLNGSYEFLEAQNNAIDELEFDFYSVSYSPLGFLVDDLTLSNQLASSTDVSEPSSLAILGLGLLGLMRFRKKF
ncbi:MAG: PEP-CTERM sorting domain-containing protein [Colwellia sp.]|nr:PEP-CTERM sorting domain-containing protein [Colwellia sp.]